MALAFRRAATAADEAFKSYQQQFIDYYGFEASNPTPVSFDWESAKKIEGSTKFNSNDEELPKAVTIANQIAGSPNYVPGIVSNIAYKAGDDHKELAFTLQRKHVRSIVIHFDDKGTVKGECNWTTEIKDGVLHATMHWNFDQYMGRPNYEDVCTWLENYLDDKEALWFEIEKSRMLKDHEGSNNRYFNSDGVKFVADTLGKELPFEYNWDEIKATPGKCIHYANQPPVSNNYMLVYNLNDGRGMYVVRDVLERILADDMGKEAFGEAFQKIRIRTVAGPKHNVDVSKDGKTLVFTFTVKMDDHQNSVRGVDGKELAKKVEALL